MKLSPIHTLSSLWILTLPALLGAKGCALGNDDASLGKTDSAGAAGDVSAATGDPGESTNTTGGTRGSTTATGGTRDVAHASGGAGNSGVTTGGARDTGTEASGGADTPTAGTSSSGTSGGAGGTLEDPGCPEYAPPLCSNGEHLTPSTDENGCPRAVCTSCPEYEPPICGDGEPIVVQPTQDGCEVEVCQACPDYAPPFCGNGEHLIASTDENGCPKPACGSCPEYALPLCGEGEDLVASTDENGCPRSICASCPAYAAPLCSEGEHIVLTTDANGCPKPACSSCPDVDISCSASEYIDYVTDENGCELPECFRCPAYESPECAEGEVLSDQTDEHGCYEPVCIPGTTCFSPTQNLETAYNGGVGCPCAPEDHSRCIEGVALICENGAWSAVEDGPCQPSTCNLPLDVSPDCEVREHIAYWHNAETGQCEPYWGGCPGNDNTFSTFDACVGQCQDRVTDTAVIQWGGCEVLGEEGSLGEQISHAGDELVYERVGQVIQIQQSWGCGCATRPEFVLTYEVGEQLRLRLCHDELADSCEALCTGTLSFDLSQAMEAAGTTDYVFVD